MISVIIPSYKNPDYLELCVESALRGQRTFNEIIVVIDGFPEVSEKVLKKFEGRGVNVITFPQNQGMQMALNVGVYNASNEKIFICNDDNVFPRGWDDALHEVYDPHTVITANQIEPSLSMFGFPTIDCGRTADSFNYGRFLIESQRLSKLQFTDDGEIFPFLINKKWYMVVGGFDTFYKSPFWCDVDLFTKLELLGLQFRRTHLLHLYHFGSIATKNRTDSDAALFRQSEHPAAQTFFYKWGWVPDLAANTHHHNTKLPNEHHVKGIQIRLRQDLPQLSSESTLSHTGCVDGSSKEAATVSKLRRPTKTEIIRFVEPKLAKLDSASNVSTMWRDDHLQDPQRVLSRT